MTNRNKRELDNEQRRRVELKFLSRNGISALIRQVLTNRKNAKNLAESKQDAKPELARTIGGDFWEFVPERQRNIMLEHYPSIVVRIGDCNNPGELDALCVRWFMATVHQTGYRYD